MAICCQTARLVKERFERSSRCWLAEGSVGGECLAVDVCVTVAVAHRSRVSRGQINSDTKTNWAVTEHLAILDYAGSSSPGSSRVISSVDPGPGDGTGGKRAEGTLSDA